MIRGDVGQDLPEQRGDGDPTQRAVADSRSVRDEGVILAEGRQVAGEFDQVVGARHAGGDAVAAHHGGPLVAGTHLVTVVGMECLGNPGVDDHPPVIDPTEQGQVDQPGGSGGDLATCGLVGVYPVTGQGEVVGVQGCHRHRSLQQRVPFAHRQQPKEFIEDDVTAGDEDRVVDRLVDRSRHGGVDAVVVGQSQQPPGYLAQDRGTAITEQCVKELDQTGMSPDGAHHGTSGWGVQAPQSWQPQQQPAQFTRAQGRQVEVYQHPGIVRDPVAASDQQSAGLRRLTQLVEHRSEPGVGERATANGLVLLEIVPPQQ
jgi:hypothetical protein